MRMYGDMNLRGNIRESFRGQIGSIDNLRKKMPIILKGDSE